MTPMLSYLFDLWNTVAPGIGDHLWQSTLFAIAAALFAVTLSKHSARIRYLVWLAASLKFLIPFSLLVVLGSWLGPAHPSAPSNTGIYFVEELSQPFSQTPPSIHAAMAGTINSITPLHWTTILFGLWLCGSLTVLFVWAARWWRISLLRRHATCLLEGREVSALRRLERSAAIDRKSVV